MTQIPPPVEGLPRHTAGHDAASDAEAVHPPPPDPVLLVVQAATAAAVTAALDALAPKGRTGAKFVADPAAPDAEDFEAQIQRRYDYVAAQIAREDGLIHNRMTWTLQLNGFLFAALALVRLPEAAAGKTGTEAVPWLVLYLLGAVPFAGLIITLAGWAGINGALLQLRYLTKEYARHCEAAARRMGWPRPCGSRHSFILGTLPMHLSMVTLTLLWAWLGARRVWTQRVDHYSESFIAWLQALVP